MPGVIPPSDSSSEERTVMHIASVEHLSAQQPAFLQRLAPQGTMDGARTIYRTTPSKPELVAPRTHRFVATSGVVDRYGDIIDPEGAVIENYLRNPVILFQHDARFGPIGRAVNLIRDGARWLIDILWMDNLLGEECFQACEAGFLNAVSIGFNPLEEPQRIATGYRFTKWDWCETSAVGVPANPDALGTKALEQPDLHVAALTLANQMEAHGLKAHGIRAWATMPAWGANGKLSLVSDRALSTEDIAAMSAILEQMREQAEDAEPNAAPKRNGVMVAIYPPAEVAAALAVEEGEAVETLHCTLAYFGDADDLGEDAIRKIKLEAGRLAAQSLPLSGVIGGCGRFNATESSDGKDVIYASVDVPDLPDFRHSLVQWLRWEDVECSHKHGFMPHITLAYVDAGAPSPVERVETIPVQFNEVHVAVGGVHTAFPFLGAAQATERAHGERLRAMLTDAGTAMQRLTKILDFATIPTKEQPTMPATDADDLETRAKDPLKAAKACAKKAAACHDTIAAACDTMTKAHAEMRGHLDQMHEQLALVGAEPAKDLTPETRAAAPEQAAAPDSSPATEQTPDISARKGLETSTDEGLVTLPAGWARG